MTDAELLQAIEKRIRSTIYATFSADGHTIEGRILKDDFDALLALIDRAGKRINDMHEALKPFAALAHFYDPPENDDDQKAWDGHIPTIGQYRRAREALK